MDDFGERADKVCERVMELLEKVAFDDDARQDLKALLQITGLLQELRKLESDTVGSSVKVVLEGGFEDYAE